MSPEIVEFHYQQLQSMFGDQLPDPQHYPIQFEYFCKLYQFYIKRNPPETALVPV